MFLPDEESYSSSRDQACRPLRCAITKAGTVTAQPSATLPQDARNGGHPGATRRRATAVATERCADPSPESIALTRYDAALGWLSFEVAKGAADDEME
jgi:hypothetical protein